MSLRARAATEAKTDWTIGHLHKAGDGLVYNVASHDRTGYWIEQLGDPKGPNRRSVSEHAIDRTVHHWRWCHCRTGLEYPDGFDVAEWELLSVYDCVAYDLHRTEATSVPPTWLCMSAEARAAIRQRFYEWSAERGFTEQAAENSPEGFTRFINARVWFNDAPELVARVNAWRHAELAMKLEREAGKPRAYFTG